MVAKVTITTTVEADGSVRLPESQIQLAGIQPGDQVRIEIVKDVEPPAGHWCPGQMQWTGLTWQTTQWR